MENGTATHTLTSERRDRDGSPPLFRPRCTCKWFVVHWVDRVLATELGDNHLAGVDRPADPPPPTTPTTSTVDEAETYANHRLDAHIAEHNLPVPTRRGWYGTMLSVHTATFADVDRWAAMLGERIAKDHIIVDADDLPDTWIVDRTHQVHIVNWLPGVMLRVAHSEIRLAPGSGAS